MPSFKPGDQVAIRCETRPGAFAGEFLVTVETVDGPISGFVREKDTVKRGEKLLLLGVVKTITPNYLSVSLRGSFFTTTGLAGLPPDNVMALAA